MRTPFVPSRSARVASTLATVAVLLAAGSTLLPGGLVTLVARAANATQNGIDAADRMQQKLEAIVRFGAIPRLETQSTVIEEGEVNAYLAHHLRSEIPPGISTPVVRILGEDRLSATATLDLDAMNAGRAPAEGFDPLGMLKGSVPAKVTGRLVTDKGSGRFELESAELGGIPLPRVLVTQIVSRYSTSADQPEGIDLDAPFDLPSSIRQIRVEPGQVTVLQ